VPGIDPGTTPPPMQLDDLKRLRIILDYLIFMLDSGILKGLEGFPVGQYTQADITRAYQAIDQEVRARDPMGYGYQPISMVEDIGICRGYD